MSSNSIKIGEWRLDFENVTSNETWVFFWHKEKELFRRHSWIDEKGKHILERYDPCKCELPESLITQALLLR